MKSRSYTLFIASNEGGSIRKLRIPSYLLHILALFSIVGGATVLAAIGSYSRMLWKVADYNSVQQEKDTLKKQYEQLQVMVTGADQRLNSLQSLATEVAMTYGLTRFRSTPFSLEPGADALVAETPDDYQQSVQQFEFLVRNAKAVTTSAQGLRLVPSWQGEGGKEESSFIPSLWPTVGPVSSAFGARLDPFYGEGAFHTGIDISGQYGDPVRVAADGVVVSVGPRAGYGRMVEVDHGFGLTTYYGHMSGINTYTGAQLKRGEVIGYVGASGRATGPHLHYEIRMHGAPVNPWRYLRGSSASGAD